MTADRPYITERPDALRRRWDTCPVSGLEPTRSPTWHLERWKAVRDLIVGWYGLESDDRDSVERLLSERVGWMDPVQRLLVERLFAGWRAIFPRDREVAVDLDPGGLSVFDHSRALELKVSPTFGFGYPDGTTELVRLRTGRRLSGADDAVVACHELDDGVVVLDALVSAGVAEAIEPPADADLRLGQLFDLAAMDRRTPLRPGRHCFSCSSAPRCGQYPLPVNGRVYVSTRSVTVSKTQLGWLGTCERRVAWDSLHQVRFDDDSELELRGGVSMGAVFHEMAAAAILADDPTEVVESARTRVAASEAAELQRLWENHVQLWEADGVPAARAVEYPAGVTFLAAGPHDDSRGRRTEQPVAVTMIGILDVTGREPDGTPMVVEHRTGSSVEHGRLELELYAVSAAEAVRRSTGSAPDRLAVHLHLLGPAQPECLRTLFGPAELAEAMERLSEEAARISRWDPADALDPGYSVGRWCDGCHHRRLCEQFR